MPKRKPPAEEAAHGLARLPPGRHGLPREVVAKNQRDRLTAGMIAAVAEHGYSEATITRITAAAGVSRRTFYGYFSSKEECFFDTYEQIASYLEEAMAAAVEEADLDWPARVRAQLDAVLESFAANPDLVRFALISPPTAGGEIAVRYRTLLDHLLEILTDGMPTSARTPSPAVEQGLLGGLAALIVRKVKADEGADLRELTPELLELVLSPYLGREEAARIARSPLG